MFSHLNDLVGFKVPLTSSNSGHVVKIFFCRFDKNGERMSESGTERDKEWKKKRKVKNKNVVLFFNVIPYPHDLPTSWMMNFNFIHLRKFNRLHFVKVSAYWKPRWMTIRTNDESTCCQYALTPQRLQHMQLQICPLDIGRNHPSFAFRRWSYLKIFQIQYHWLYYQLSLIPLVLHPFAVLF